MRKLKDLSFFRWISADADNIKNGRKIDLARRDCMMSICSFLRHYT